MRGDMVIVRAFGAIPAAMRVWEEFPETVCVLPPQQQQGTGDYWPIGFPRTDVFCYDEKALKAQTVRWDRLIPY